MSAALDNHEWSHVLGDRLPGAGGAQGHVSVDVAWSDDTAATLSALSGGESLASVAIALCGAIVARYSSDDVWFEATSRLLAPARAGKRDVTYVGMGVDLTDDPSFRELVARSDALATQQADVQGADQPLAPIVVDLCDDASDLPFPKWGGGERAPALYLLLRRDEVGLRGRVAFPVDRWSPAMRACFADAWAALADGIANDPDRPLSRHVLVREAIARQLIVDWNATQVPRDDALDLHRLVERQVERSPAALAVEYEGARLTYGELNARANQLARELVKRGVQRGVMVGISMERSLELVVAVLAVLKAGGAFVPMDPDLPSDRMTYVLTDTRAPLLLVQPHLHDRLQAAAAMADSHVLQIPPLSDPAFSGATTNLGVRSAPTDLAYLIFTSGSTGKPKGVCIPHRAVCNHALWFADAIALSEQDRMLQYASISFDAAIAELFGPLVAGATLVMAPPYAHRDVLGIADVVRDHRVTVLQMVPSALRAALAADRFSNLPTLRQLISGGESLDRSCVHDIRRQLPHVRLGNFYGPSEASVDSTMISIDETLDDRQVLPIGRPIANARCYILDRHLQPVPVGAPGHLYIAGRGLALGYHQQPALTALRFIDDPFTRGEKMYRSGDLARYHSDGSIEYLGRADTQVKMRGYRIELAEIETALRHYPGVREAAVVVRDDENGEPALVAYLVCAPGITPPAAQALMTRLRQSLPAYAVPSAYGFLSALPLTTSAKLDRRALAERPIPRGSDVVRSDRAPLADPIAERLRVIWEQMLGVSPVEIDDDFFALGGHSLKAIRLLNEVEREFGIDVRGGVLFEAPTIRKFAQRIRERTPNPVSTVIPVQPDGRALPLFFVPGGAGELFVFDALAAALGDDQPLHVMDLYAFGDASSTLPASSSSAPTITLAEIAARMISDMRQIQAHGPYQLAGYSLGGNIALEIAQQLRAAGDDVRSVLLLDCDGPDYPILQPFAARTMTHMRHALSLGPGSSLRYVRDRITQLSRKLRGAPPPAHTLFDKEEELALIPPNVIERMERALAPLIVAWEAYVPRRYDGPVTLVRADIRQQMVGVIDSDPLLGWGGILTNLTTTRMPCGHFDLLRAPMAPRLAEIVQSVFAPPASP